MVGLYAVIILGAPAGTASHSNCDNSGGEDSNLIHSFLSFFLMNFLIDLSNSPGPAATNQCSCPEILKTS
jgi:hypothetical protein